MYRLNISAKTWKKDSYELIDYDSRQLNEDNLETKNEGYIYRNLNKIEFSANEKVTNIPEKLLEIKKIENNVKLELNEYQLDEDENIKTPNSTWFLLRREYLDERMNEYNLKEGDILKIGRITIRIKSIKFKKNSEINPNFKEIQENNTKNMQETNKQQQNKTCRICYLEEEDANNPLIQPCICSGSMKYIHLNCLKKWLNTTVFIKIESKELCNIYLYKKAECELCKTIFPDSIKHKGKIYDIFDFYNDFNNCLIIESLTLDKNKNKYLYVINLEAPNNRINIGRGHGSQVILNEISVSRIHSILNINKSSKKVFISDNNSKFGTLILVQTNNINMKIGLKLHLQIGRTYLEFLIKGSSNIFGCFGVSEKNNPDCYYIQNKNKNKEVYIKNEIDSDVNDNNKNNIQNIEKIKEYENLNTNPNLNVENLDEILLTPLKSNGNDELNYIQEKNEECIVINDDNIDEKNSIADNKNNLNNSDNKNEEQKKNENI